MKRVNRDTDTHPEGGDALAAPFMDSGGLEEASPNTGRGEDIRTALEALMAAVRFADPPKLFNDVLCHEARVPVEFIEDAERALAINGEASPVAEVGARPSFEREERYIVIKRKHLTAIQETSLRAHMARLAIGTIECVVVESDWPEYETVWRMIEDRVAAALATPPHVDPYAHRDGSREGRPVDANHSSAPAPQQGEAGVREEGEPAAWAVAAERAATEAYACYMGDYDGEDTSEGRRAAALAIEAHATAALAQSPAPDAALPAGMKPWAGGDAAPEDWDEGEVLYRNGMMGRTWNKPARWAHAAQSQLSLRDSCTWMNAASDIIAYTPRSAPDATMLEKVAEEQASLEAYLSDYEYCGDNSYYTPTEWERELIGDALQGWLADRLPSSPRPPTPGTVGAEIAALAQPQTFDAGEDVIASALHDAVSWNTENCRQRDAWHALLVRVHDLIGAITDRIEDEGDRAYFGSTNDADKLRAIFHELEIEASKARTPDETSQSDVGGGA